MTDKINCFEGVALELRMQTATLENLQGQIFDGSYRKGSLMIFRAMVMKEALDKNFDETMFLEFKEKVDEISDFVGEVLKSPGIFGSYLQ